MNTARVKAGMTDGVLVLARSLQRAEEDKPKRVSLSSRKGRKSTAASKKSGKRAKQARRADTDTGNPPPADQHEGKLPAE